jgi:phenylpropionate dioxygenase-like ring-hydroxylating dioxygenase large terminal subunit
MRNYWYPICTSKELGRSKPLKASLFDVPLALFRNDNNETTCLLDICPHRATALSSGSVMTGSLRCPYHGWRFGNKGQCLEIPSQPKSDYPKSCNAYVYPSCEYYGLVWVTLTLDLANVTSPKDYYRSIFDAESDAGLTLVTQGKKDVPVNFALMIENILDATHFPFTHGGMIAKKGVHEPIEIAKKNEAQGFYGHISYPQRQHSSSLILGYNQPCVEYFKFRFGSKRKLHQMIFCVPLTKTTTRIFYFIYQNWLKTPILWPLLHLCHSWFINTLIAQDQRMIAHQQRNIARGISPWGHPVQADILALDFRAFFEEKNAMQDPWFKNFPHELNHINRDRESLTASPFPRH